MHTCVLYKLPMYIFWYSDDMCWWGNGHKCKFNTADHADEHFKWPIASVNCSVWYRALQKIHCKESGEA